MSAKLWLLLLALWPTAAADVVTLNTGEKRSGRIAELTASGIRLEVPLERPGGSPVLAIVQIPRTSVRSIEFTSSPELAAATAGNDPAQASRLAGFWSDWASWIEVPGSPAGRIGVALGNALTVSRDPADLARAQEVFRHVEEKSPDPDDRAAAKRGRLQALLLSGRAREAATEAEEIARSTRDESLLLEAKFQVAVIAKDSLEKLQQDNPRWTEDPLIGPERDRLYHEALDQSLYPVVSHGAPPAAASRGLWLAAQIHRIAGDDDAAIECSKDIVAIYPSSSEAGPAGELLAALPPKPRGAIPAASSTSPQAAAEAAPAPKEKLTKKKTKPKTKRHEPETKKPR